MSAANNNNTNTPAPAADAAAPKFELWNDNEWKSYQSKQSFAEMAKERLREDPAVPLFTGLAVVALVGGMRQSFFTNNTKRANQFMFARVGFQGAAVAACVWSVYKAIEKMTASPAKKDE